MGDELRQLTTGLGAAFAALEGRAKTMMELAAKVREALSGPEKDHVISASYKGTTLIVIADSAAWSTHIHYAQERLLERVSGPADMRFTKLRVKVGQPPGNEATQESSKG